MYYPMKMRATKGDKIQKKQVRGCAVVLGIICFIVGLILSFTGIGATIGLPIGLGGVYFISHAKEM